MVQAVQLCSVTLPDGIRTVSDAEFKQGQTQLSEGASEGYVSMQLESGDGQLQAFTICETRQEGIKEKEATFVSFFFELISCDFPIKRNTVILYL